MWQVNRADKLAWHTQPTQLGKFNQSCWISLKSESVLNLQQNYVIFKLFDAQLWKVQIRCKFEKTYNLKIV